MAELLQRLHCGEGVPLIVVDNQDPSRQRRVEIGRSFRLRPPLGP